MEHIIQFGVNIDDDAIAKKVADLAAKEVKEKIAEKTRRGYYSSDNFIDEEFRKEIKNVIDANKDEIIDKAVTALMANMVKTKAVRTAIDDMITNIE